MKSNDRRQSNRGFTVDKALPSATVIREQTLWLWQNRQAVLYDIICDSVTGYNGNQYNTAARDSPRSLFHISFRRVINCFVNIVNIYSHHWHRFIIKTSHILSHQIYLQHYVQFPQLEHICFNYIFFNLYNYLCFAFFSANMRLP